jgi:hypothetical protein
MSDKSSWPDFMTAEDRDAAEQRAAIMREIRQVVATEIGTEKFTARMMPMIRKRLLEAAEAGDLSPPTADYIRGLR